MNQQGRLNHAYKHGGYVENKPEYNTWHSMIGRCKYPSSRSYSSYGGRGITVAERWTGTDGFVNFLEDMGKRPSKDYSIDRIDNDGNYEPGNCRWANRLQQSANTSKSRTLVIDGIKATLAEHCRRYGIDPRIVATREHNLGWEATRAITTPVKRWGYQPR